MLFLNFTFFAAVRLNATVSHTLHEVSFILPGGARTTDSNDVISTTADRPVTMKTDMIEHLFSLDLDFGMRCWKSLTLPQYSELMKKLTSDQMSCRCDLLPCEAYGMQVPPDVQRRKSSIVRDIRNQQILSILETSPEYTVLYSLVAVMGTAGKHPIITTADLFYRYKLLLNQFGRGNIMAKLIYGCGIASNKFLHNLFATDIWFTCIHFILRVITNLCEIK